MNIFISWSGDRSRKIAELFNEWIQCVIQAASPWISSHDIDRGALWFPEISKTLADSRFGIICLTPENMNEPWILFEAGALAKGIEENRVCTLLTELKDTDVKGPLAHFNHTFASSRESMWELVRTINKSVPEKPLQETVLTNVFDTYWERFIKKHEEIVKEYRPEGRVRKRTTEDMLEEVLTTVRSIDKKLPEAEMADFGIKGINKCVNKCYEPDTYSFTPREIVKLINLNFKAADSLNTQEDDPNTVEKPIRPVPSGKK